MWIERGGLRRRHRHLHRLVAGLGGGIGYRRQRRRIADRFQPVERGTTRAEHGDCRQQGTTQHQNAFRHRTNLSTDFTLGPTYSELCSPLSTTRVITGPTVTRSGPEMTACTTRLDSELSTPIASPTPPASCAWPRSVSVTPGAS